MQEKNDPKATQLELQLAAFLQELNLADALAIVRAVESLCQLKLAKQSGIAAGDALQKMGVIRARGVLCGMQAQQREKLSALLGASHELGA